MKLFIDTANIEEIKKANDLGVISGVTTNPSLIAKEGRSIEEVIKEIIDIVDGPISVEVMALDCHGMVEEGKKWAKLHENIVIKIPMTLEGLKAIKELSQLDIKTNVTLIFSSTQALLAARAGATYVSPFIGRLDDISFDGVQLVREISTMFKNHQFQTEIIAASIRHNRHVIDATLANAHIATIPYKIFKQMAMHPLTDKGIKKFIDDYKKAFSK